MSAASTPAGARTRRDLCPGVSRPWPAADGALVRLRLIGGRVGVAALRALLAVATTYGDGAVHLTARANLQLRALPSAGDDRRLDPAVADAIAATGLLPAPAHELVRNVMVSPLTGIEGGRTDLRPVARDLDAFLCGRPRLAQLPGRFLFVLDDGRGDLVDRPTDLGLVALDATTAQVRVGEHWGEAASLGTAAGLLVQLAWEFLDARGDGPRAPWHVRELATPLMPAYAPDPRVPAPSGPPAYDARHRAVPDGVLTAAGLDDLLGDFAGPEVVVTPWHGIVVP